MYNGSGGKVGTLYDPTMSLVYPTNLICNDNENRRKRKQIESYFEVYV